MLTEEADRQARSRRRRWPHRPGFTGDLFGEHNRLEMLLHRVSVLPDESLIVALLSSLIVALQISLKTAKVSGVASYLAAFVCAVACTQSAAIEPTCVAPTCPTTDTRNDDGYPEGLAKALSSDQ
jgi:hypothetical protein